MNFDYVRFEMALVRNDVTEEHSTAIIMVKRINELGTLLVASSK
jgi:hypothetical protein